MKTRYLILILFALSLAVLGCSRVQPKEEIFVEAGKAREKPKLPAVIKVPKLMPLPGQLQRHPSEKRKKKVRMKTWEVIEKNNLLATHKPNDEGYFNSIMQYDFSPGALFKIYCAPLRLTDIQLQPGEKILGKPAAGDTARWLVGLGKSMNANGLEQQHVYVKPVRPSLYTTLAINTDRRTYHIELRSYRETYMAAVSWIYPLEQIAMIQREADLAARSEEAVTAALVNIDNLNFAYRCKVKKGKRPVWFPVKVFDDGRKTFVQFPQEMLVREAPAFFVLSERGNKGQLVNYRVRNEYYVVDRLFDRAELRMGQKKQVVVRIERAEK